MRHLFFYAVRPPGRTNPFFTGCITDAAVIFYAARPLNRTGFIGCITDIAFIFYAVRPPGIKPPERTNFLLGYITNAAFTFYAIRPPERINLFISCITDTAFYFLRR